MAATDYLIGSGAGWTMGITYDPARSGRVSAVWCDNQSPYPVTLTAVIDGVTYTRVWEPGDRVGRVNIPQSNRITLTFDAEGEPIFTGVQSFSTS